MSEDRVDPSANENSLKQIHLHYLYLKGKEKGFGKGSIGKIVPVPYGSDRMQIGACGSEETFLFLDSKPIAPFCITITSQKRSWRANLKDCKNGMMLLKSPGIQE